MWKKCEDMHQVGHMRKQLQPSTQCAVKDNTWIFFQGFFPFYNENVPKLHGFHVQTCFFNAEILRYAEFNTRYKRFHIEIIWAFHILPQKCSYFAHFCMWNVCFTCGEMETLGLTCNTWHFTWTFTFFFVCFFTFNYKNISNLHVQTSIFKCFTSISTNFTSNFK